MLAKYLRTINGRPTFGALLTAFSPFHLFHGAFKIFCHPKHDGGMQDLQSAKRHFAVAESLHGIILGQTSLQKSKSQNISKWST
jgi:hypothetical protein